MHANYNNSITKTSTNYPFIIPRKTGSKIDFIPDFH